MQYYPFGEVWVEQRRGIKLLPNYTFTGKEFDEETKLFYYGARYYDPRTSVWQSTDKALETYVDGIHNSGVYYSMNIALYSYANQNPVIFFDPDGNAPNQAGATNPGTILAELRGYEAQGLNQIQALAALSANHGGNNDRYFFTDDYGWIDVRHFGKAAELASGNEGNVWVEVLGLGNEVAQWLTEWGDAYRSGFSPEDVPSNAAGARLGEKIKSSMNLGDMFEQWTKDVGGRDITDPKTDFVDLPLTDPSVRGGANRGSSNPGSIGPGANLPTGMPAPKGGTGTGTGPTAVPLRDIIPDELRN